MGKFLDESGVATLWELIKAEDAKGVKIETGSYVGTGTTGASGANTLTFPFAPKMVFMLGRKDTWGGTGPLFGSLGEYPSYSNLAYHYVMAADLLTTAYQKSVGFQDNYNSLTCYGKKSEDGKTFSWYHDSGATYQMNYTGYEYFYLAIG